MQEKLQKRFTAGVRSKRVEVEVRAGGGTTLVVDWLSVACFLLAEEDRNQIKSRMQATPLLSLPVVCVTYLLRNLHWHTVSCETWCDWDVCELTPTSKFLCHWAVKKNSLDSKYAGRHNERAMKKTCQSVWRERKYSLNNCPLAVKAQIDFRWDPAMKSGHVVCLWQMDYQGSTTEPASPHPGPHHGDLVRSQCDLESHLLLFVSSQGKWFSCAWSWSWLQFE